MKELIIPIKGMHCRSCEITLTDKLEQLSDVEKAEVSLKTRSATLYARRMPPSAAIRHAVASAGYSVGHEDSPWLSKDTRDYKDVAIGVAIVVLLAFVVSKLNISGFNMGNIAVGGTFAALFVGLTAGFSTCMALVGGLVLGLSAKHAEKHPSATVMQKFRPHIFFNISRIVSFFLLGGLIGAAGSVFQLQGTLLGVLTILVGIVMLMLGLQLTNLFPKLSGGGLTLPSGVAKRLGIHERNKREYSHKNAAILGAVSFFLPCGFTQAMQLYAVSTGSFTEGALVMGLFAVGTMPGLLGVGGLASAIEGNSAKRFFKIAGVAVVAMALLNISNGYNLTGFQRPFSFVSQLNRSKNKPASSLTLADDEYPIDGSRLSATYTLKKGMVPTEFRVKANQLYTLEVASKDNGFGCMSTILIPGLNNKIQTLTKGETHRLPFRAPMPGTYQITCAMGVPHGKIIAS